MVGAATISRVSGARQPDRRRVLTLIHNPAAMGGAEKVAVDLATSLDRDRFEPLFCAIKRPRAPTREGELRAAGVPFFPLDRGSIRDPRGLAALVRLLRRERVDILHSHLWDANVMASVAGRLARTPVLVAHEHTWSFEGEPVRVATDRFLVARSASAFVCVSAADRRKMIEIERIPPERIRVVTNGIAPLPAPSGRDVRAELGLAPTAQVIGVVAVFRMQKRLDILVRALARLARRLPDPQLVIAGDDVGLGARRQVEQLAEALGLTSRLHVLGQREDIADVLAAFDVACLASDYEGMPLSLMEYMAAGKPIVSTGVGGVVEMIEHGVEGLLVPRREPDALAEALETVLTNRGLAESLGRAAQARQRRDFSLEAVVARVEDLYDELCGSRRPGSRT